MRFALVELLGQRARERGLQEHHRSRRNREASRRALGVSGSWLTADLDVHGGLTRHAVTLAVENSGVGALSDSDLDRTKQITGELSEHECIRAAWLAAWISFPWSRGDWTGRATLSEAGWHRFFWVALLAIRGALALRSGFGEVQTESADQWWLVLARPWLSNEEIGVVTAAADRLDPGIAEFRVPDADAMDRAFEHAVEQQSARLDEGSSLPTIDYARRTTEKWRRMTSRGWGTATRRT